MGKGGGILPVTIHNNKLYFLFGLDRDGWSDFGGSKEEIQMKHMANREKLLRI